MADETAGLKRFIVGKYVCPETDELIPVSDTIVTVSRCITEVLPDTWMIDGYEVNRKKQVKGAAKFGIPAAAIDELVAWYSPVSGGLPYTIPSLPVAQNVLRRCGNKTDILLLGIGLHRTLLASV